MSACRYSALRISTRCCVPTGRSSTSAAGSTCRPYWLGQRPDPLGRHARGEQPGLRRLVAEHDVLGHGEHRHQLEVLVDHADAAADGVAGVVQVDDLAVDQDLALVGLVQPEQHLDQRALAGAVLAEQPEDLAPPQLDRHVVVGVAAVRSAWSGRAPRAPAGPADRSAHRSRSLLHERLAGRRGRPHLAGEQRRAPR